MLKKLFQRLGRYRVIMDRVDNELYLERYYVFLKDRERFPFNIFVHKFLKSDPDDLHDHPWPFFTIMTIHCSDVSFNFRLPNICLF